MKKRWRKFWRWGLLIYFITFLFQPISIVFDPGPYETSAGQWIHQSVLNTKDYVLLLGVFALLYIFIPRMNNTLRKTAIIALLLLSLVASLGAFIAFVLPSQDSMPDIGMPLIILLFPLALINMVFEWKEKPQAS